MINTPFPINLITPNIGPRLAKAKSNTKTKFNSLQKGTYIKSVYVEPVVKEEIHIIILELKNSSSD